MLLLPSCIHGMVSTEASLMAYVNRGWVMDSCWGLGRGLLSGLLSTTSGALEVPAGGWPPTEVLALFTLWASVSASLPG